eukprot:5738904-Amphidinium_carterae.1
MLTTLVAKGVWSAAALIIRGQRSAPAAFTVLGTGEHRLWHCHRWTAMRHRHLSDARATVGLPQSHWRTVSPARQSSAAVVPTT